MPEKGSSNGECVTPGCTSESRWIAIAEAPVAEVPQERYRCARCCDLVAHATPVRPADIFHGMPEWDEWHAEMVRVLALPLAELAAASASAFSSGE